MRVGPFRLVQHPVLRGQTALKLPHRKRSLMGFGQVVAANISAKVFTIQFYKRRTFTTVGLFNGKYQLVLLSSAGPWKTVPLPVNVQLDLVQFQFTTWQLFRLGAHRHVKLIVNFRCLCAKPPAQAQLACICRIAKFKFELFQLAT